MGMKVFNATGGLIDLAEGNALLRILSVVRKDPAAAGLAYDDLLMIILEAVQQQPNLPADLASRLPAQIGSGRASLVALVMAQPEIHGLVQKLSNSVGGLGEWLFIVDGDAIVPVSLKSRLGAEDLNLKWSTDGSSGGSGNGLVWQVQAAGAVDATARALTPAAFSLTYQQAVSSGFDDPVGLELHIGVGVSAQLKLKTNPGGYASLGIGGGFGAGLELLFEHPGATPAIAALANGLQRVPDLGDLDRVYAALLPTGVAGLRHIRLIGAREGSLNFELDVAKQTLSASVSKAVTLTRTGAFTLTVRAKYAAKTSRGMDLWRDASGELMLRSERRVGTDRSASWGVGVSLQIEGLDKLAKAYVDDALPDPGPIQDLLKKYAQPGSLLTELLLAEVNKLKTKEARSLAGLLIGHNGAPATAASLVTDLLSPISEAVDTVVDVFDANLSKIKDLAGELAARLDQRGLVAPGQLPSLTAKLENLLQKPLTGLRAQLEQDLQAQLSALNGKATAVVAKALAPLADFGARVSQAAANLNTAATELIGPLNSLLKRYAKNRAELVENLELLAEMQFSLALSGEYERTESRTQSLTLALKPAGAKFLPASQDSFRRWWLGEPLTPANFIGEVRLVDATQRLTRSTTRGLKAIMKLGPLQASYDVRSTAAIDLVAGHDGVIRDASASFARTESAKSGKRSWVVRFGGLVQAALAQSGSADTLVTVSVEYQSLKADSEALEELLASIALPVAGASLISEEKRTAARRAFVDSNAKALRVQFAVSVPLPKLLEIDSNPEVFKALLAESLWDARLSFQPKLAELAGYWSGKTFAEILPKIAKSAASIGFRSDSEDLSKLFPDAEIRIVNKGSEVWRGLEALRILARAWLDADPFLKSLEDLSAHFQRLDQPVPAAANATAGGLNAHLGALAAELHQASERASVSISDLLDAQDQLFPSDKLARDTLAFMAVLSRYEPVDLPENNLILHVGLPVSSGKDLRWTRLRF